MPDPNPATGGGYALIYATERSSFKANAPTAAELENMYRSAATVTGGVYPVGPGPRVVRFDSVGAVTTHVAWLVGYDDPAALSVYVAALQTMLRTYSKDFSAVVTQLYKPNIHGTLDWWKSGDATQTQTRNVPEDEWLVPAAVENPIGPGIDSAAKYIRWGFVGLGLTCLTAFGIGYARR